MPTLTRDAMGVKPQTNEYEVWCEDCEYIRNVGPAFAVGSEEDKRALDRVFALRKAHAVKHPGHFARARMHSRNIDIGGDIVRTVLEEERR